MGSRHSNRRPLPPWLFFVVLLLSTPMTTAFADCLQYRDYIHWAGAVDTPGTAADIVSRDGFSFVADGTSVLVYDTSNPDIPVLVATLPVADQALALAFWGSRLCVADGTGGLLVVDVSDPFAPTVRFRVSMPGQALDVAVSGHFAYVAAREAGLQIVDLAHLPAPVIAGGIPIPGWCQSVATQDSIAFVGTDIDEYDDALFSIEVTDPARCRILDSLHRYGEALGILPMGGIAYVSWRNDVTIVKISNPADLTVLTTLDLPADAFAVQGDLLYAAGSGLSLYNISDPLAPLWVSCAGTLGEGTGLVLVNGRAILAAQSAGLQIVDVSNPVLPDPLGIADTPGSAEGMDRDGNFVFVADGGSGLQVVDVSFPQTPEIVGSLALPGFAWHVKLAPPLAYVACNSAGLYIVDVSDPHHPALLGGVATPSYAIRVALYGSYAFVTNYTSGMQIVDVSDPHAPAIVGNVMLSHQVCDIAIQGPRAYVATDNSGLYILDISNPLAPVVLGNAPTPDCSFGVAVQEPYAYMADRYGHLQVVDVSDPSAPFIAGAFDLGGVAYRVSVRGPTLYLTNMEADYQIVDVSDPTTPQFIFEGPGVMWDMIATEDLLLGAEADRGLVIRPLQCVATGVPAIGAPERVDAVRRVRVRPTPAAGPVDLSVESVGSDEVSVLIYEATGRLIRTLAGGIAGGSSVTVRWDRRDGSGREVAPGVYLARVSTREGTRTVRVVLVR